MIASFRQPCSPLNGEFASACERRTRLSATYADAYDPCGNDSISGGLLTALRSRASSEN